MSLLYIFIVLIVVGILLYWVNEYLPLDAKIKKIINIVAIVIIVIWLLKVFGVWGYLEAASI